MTNMRLFDAGEQSAGDSRHYSGAPVNGRGSFMPDTALRLSFWFTVDGQCVQWNAETWDHSFELETILVVPVGPFDDEPSLAHVLVEALGELGLRGVQCRLF